MIEILIVFFLGSVLIVFGLQLLNLFTIGEQEGSLQNKLDFYFNFARQKAFKYNQKYVLEIDLEEQTFGIRNFVERLDNSIATTTSELALGYEHDSEILEELGVSSISELYSKIKEDEAAFNKELKERLERGEELEETIDWLIEKQALFTKIKKVYSLSLLEINSPIIKIFFYPNGTSDGLLLQLENAPEGSLLYLPNESLPSRYIFIKDITEKLENTDEEEEEASVLLELKKNIKQ